MHLGGVLARLIIITQEGLSNSTLLSDVQPMHTTTTASPPGGEAFPSSRVGFFLPSVALVVGLDIKLA